MADKKKVDCKYGADCYRRNPEHLNKYNHPSNKMLSDEEDKNKKRNPSPLLVIENDSKRIKCSPTPNKPPQLNNQDIKNEGTTSGETNLDVDNNEENRREVTSKNEPADDKDQVEVKKQLVEKSVEKEMDITKEYNEVIKNLSRSHCLDILQQRICYCEQAEYRDLLNSREFIRHKFLVEMPPDFYKFWEFCKSISTENQRAENVFEKFGLKLVGPFDFLAFKFHAVKRREPADYLRHWRFYYDPPEFQTIFVKDKTCLHYGYWRDDPKEKESLLMAKNDANKNCEFEFIGGNCFETVLYFLNKDVVTNPFNKAEIEKTKKQIETYARDNGIDLNTLFNLKKKRNIKVVCKTFHKAGLVVPIDRKTDVGYRPLIETEAELKKILNLFDQAKGDEDLISAAKEKLQPMITAASIAADECDFGTSVELGINLFCSGHQELHGILSSLLINGYKLLQRPQFIAIMKAHLENRKKGSNLSFFEK